MGPQKSDTLEELEQVLDTYSPDQRTVTTMIIKGPDDVLQDELALLAHGADLFDVDVATVYGDTKEEVLAVFDGNAHQVGQLITFVNGQLKAASAR